MAAAEYFLGLRKIVKSWVAWAWWKFYLQKADNKELDFGVNRSFRRQNSTQQRSNQFREQQYNPASTTSAGDGEEWCFRCVPQKFRDFFLNFAEAFRIFWESSELTSWTRIIYFRKISFDLSLALQSFPNLGNPIAEYVCTLINDFDKKRILIKC